MDTMFVEGLKENNIKNFWPHQKVTSIITQPFDQKDACWRNGFG